MTSISDRTEPVTGPDPPGEPRISIVIPALNESRNLEVVLPDLPPVHEVILVDGHSADGTVETARRLLPGIRVVRQTRRGKGNALACGFHAATGDIIVAFDADGSADPAEIPAFVGALLDGADFAKGTRFGTGAGSRDITPVRRLGNRALSQLTNALFRRRYSDLCYGYNAFWADLLPMLQLPDLLPTATSATAWGDGFEIETMVTCRLAAAGARVTEVPSVERTRIHGLSNLHALRDGLRVLRTIVIEFARSRRRSPAALPLRAYRHRWEQA